MKVKCKECGFEDEGRFCSNCGAPLPQDSSVARREVTGPPPDLSWLAKCPVYKSGELTQTTKKEMFGLAVSEHAECSHCGAVFDKDGARYKLAKVQDRSAQVWQDYGKRSLTKREWKTIAYGGMSDAKQEKVDIDFWMTELREGNIPIRYEGKALIVLKKNEELQLALPGISLIEPRSVRHTYGGYGGPSFRVAKGVSFRVGGFGARSESHEELRTTDQGLLLLTNKRLVFCGTKRTVDADLRKIVSVDAFKDGIALSRSGKGKTEYFSGVDRTELTITVDNRQYQPKVSGLMLKYLIEGLTRKLG